MTYFIAGFLVAFMLGIIRVLVLVPRPGEIVSVSIETPLILAVSWFASRWATAKFRVTNEVSPGLTMGAVAFALLMMWNWQYRPLRLASRSKTTSRRFGQRKE